MAEEDEAAAKAAAKRAKKLKQKAKKQQAQTSLALSPSLGDSLPNADSTQTGQEPCQKGQEPSQIGQELSSVGQEASTSGQGSYMVEQATSVAHQLFRSEDEATPANSGPSQAFSSASQLLGDGSLVQADSDRHASVAPQSTPPLATTSPARPLSEAISEARPQTGVDVSVSFDALTVINSSQETAERQAGRAGTGSTVASGQDAEKDADEDAKFLHTLFCCPITKVRM